MTTGLARWYEGTMRHVESRAATEAELDEHAASRRREWARVWSYAGLALTLIVVANASLYMSRDGAWAFLPFAVSAGLASIVVTPWGLITACLHWYERVRTLPVAEEGLELDAFRDEATGQAANLIIHPDHARSLDWRRTRVAVTAPMRDSDDAAGELSEIERAEFSFVLRRAERRTRSQLAAALAPILGVASQLSTPNILLSVAFAAAVAIILMPLAYTLARADLALVRQLRADLDAPRLRPGDDPGEPLLEHSGLLWQRDARPGPERCRNGGLADPRFAGERFNVANQGRIGF